VTAKVTRNGAISIPAALRNRWQAKLLLVEDHGSYAVLRPVAPDDEADDEGHR
jgi:bifunctional DNA-binding transcriptional regulator/antitoxin component of YhaV-PrlF toxin-antitoxin module